tara:strand:- start:518 stop:1126 length:609 start_codon:yes stop_codon:yes gene_type:complete
MEYNRWYNQTGGPQTFNAAPSSVSQFIAQPQMMAQAKVGGSVSTPLIGSNSQFLNDTAAVISNPVVNMASTGVNNAAVIANPVSTPLTPVSTPQTILPMDPVRETPVLSPDTPVVVSTPEAPVLVPADTLIVADTPVVVTPVVDDVAVVENVEPVVETEVVVVPETQTAGFDFKDKKFLTGLVVGVAAFLIYQSSQGKNVLS